MSGNDDIVLSPTLDDHAPTNVQRRATEGHRMRDAATKRWTLHRMVRAKLAGATTREIGGAIASGVRGAIADRAAMAGAATPVGAIITAIAVGAAVATRLISGRSFENIGNEIKETLLGDLTENALATEDVRAAMQGDDDLSRIANRTRSGDKVNSQIKSIFNDLKEISRRDHLGRKLFELDPHYQVNGTADMLILRIADKIKAAWNGAGGPDAVMALETRYKKCLTLGVIGQASVR